MVSQCNEDKYETYQCNEDPELTRATLDQFSTYMLLTPKEREEDNVGKVNRTGFNPSMTLKFLKHIRSHRPCRVVYIALLKEVEGMSRCIDGEFADRARRLQEQIQDSI